MSIGVIFLLVLAGWWAGPRLCQIVGGGLVVITTLMWLFPRWISYNPLLHLAVTLVGAGMWWLGVLWQSGRDAGRGPLVWDLAVERVPTLLHSLRTRSMLALRDARQPAAEHSSHSKPPPPHVAQPAAGRGRWRWRRAPEPADIQHGTPDHLSDGEVIDGVAYDLNDNSGEEDDVILERGLREDVDRTLEHAREHLEPIVHRLFAQTGGRWRERLNTARWQRRGDLPPIPDGHRPFEDRRLVFSTIAYDWSLIASAFIQDPSRPARTLCAISNRYAHEGPRASDPAAARRAFADICAALRPQSVRTALDQSKPLRPSGV